MLKSLLHLFYPEVCLACKNPLFTNEISVCAQCRHQLPLTLHLENPDNEVKIDTLEYAMANPDGTLMGEGFSDIKENKLWYQENFVFKKSGDYKIFVTHALRETGSITGVETLPGITEVGFRIEKTEE